MYLIMKKSFILILLMAGWALRAQYPVDTVYQSHTATTPGLPALYGSVTDTAVPSPVVLTRITDYVPEWDWYPHHEYAKIQPWNADATMYKFYSVALYDATDYHKIRDLPGGEIWPSYWSNTDPDKIWSFRQNGDIRYYRISTDSVYQAGHIYLSDSAQTDYQAVMLGPGEGNMDRNDRFVALACQAGADMDVVVYDLQADSVVVRRRFAGAWGNSAETYPHYVDWVSVSQSGQYTGIMWDHNTTSASSPFAGHYGVEIYRTQDMQFLRRIAEYGNHGDFGYDSSGNEVFVQFWGPTGTLNMYYLDHLERVVLSNHPDFGGEGHISCRNLQRPGWAYVSQDEAARSGLMVAVRLDSSGRVEFFGHHFSTAASYLKSPMPVPSPDGTQVMFKSDFGDGNPDVVYTFVARAQSQAAVAENTQADVQIFPNPAHGRVYVIAPWDFRNAALYDPHGRLIRRYLYLRNGEMNLDGLAPGLYVLRLIGRQGQMFAGLVEVY